MNHIFRKRDKNNKFRWLSCSYQSGSQKKSHFDDGICFRSASVIGFELPKYKHRLWQELLTPKFVPNETYECDDDDDGNIESELLVLTDSPLFLFVCRFRICCTWCHRWCFLCDRRCPYCSEQRRSFRA